MVVRTLTLLAAVSAVAGCSQSPTFAAGTPILAAQAGSPAANAVTKSESYTYGLAVGSGTTVLPQAKTATLPTVYLSGSTAPLAGQDLANWQVKIYLQGQAPDAAGPVASTPLDLSKASGMVTAEADFSQINGGLSGSAYQSFFVDGEAPRGSLLRLSSSASGDQSQVFWAATDNFRVNQTNSELIGCAAVDTSFSPQSFAALATLPADCAVVYAGAALFSQPGQLNLGALTIAGVSVLPANVHYALYVEDMVGLNTFTWITEPAQDQGQLILATQPSAVQYTNSAKTQITLQLQEQNGANTTNISDQSNSGNWSAFSVSLAINGASGSATDEIFAPQLNYLLPGADGLYSVAVQATETGGSLQSNTKNVLFILDTTPPVVGGIQAVVPGNVLSAQAMVNLTWSATDTNGIASQTIEIMQTGATVYTPVATLTGGQTSYSFPWGSRTNKGFVIRITATDPAGNSTKAVSAPWTPQIFNAAILTSSVDCFFCHAKVSGDVGGINFSQTPRSDTGINFNVTDEIFGTNTVPALLAAAATNGATSNYTNSPLTIFPKNNQFPVMTSASLLPRMDGTVQLGSLFISRVYQGNLILDGSQTNTPIVVSGEVFINGDLVIKGKYKGVGTIYANNIYIVDDLVATTSPFPFPDDPAQALTDAQAAVANHSDALYLGALNQVLVGNVEGNLGNACGALCINTTPYSWLPQANFLALGEHATYLKDTSGVAHAVAGTHFDPTSSDPRALMEVDRVDAFIYAQNVFSWYVYANIALNGGFMAPSSGFVSAVPYAIFNSAANQAIKWAPNPRNSLLPTQNVIRYDYRLRAGGAGFETIKSFFDQQ